VGSVLETKMLDQPGEIIVRSPAVFHHPKKRKLVLWSLLSSAPPEEPCIFGVAEATEVLGPFAWANYFNLTKDFDVASKCTGLQPVVEPEGDFYALLVRFSNGSTRPESRLVVLDDDLLGIRETLRFNGVSGSVQHLVNHGGFWHLFTIGGEIPTSKLRQASHHIHMTGHAGNKAQEDILLSDVEESNALWTARSLSAQTVWSSSGSPTQVKVYKKDGHPERSISLMLNREVGCALLLYHGGKLAARCGPLTQMFPIPPL